MATITGSQRLLILDGSTLSASVDITKNGNSVATEGYVNTTVSNLVAAAPGTLDTLNELAAALGDDPNFATTVTNSIATKLPLAGGTITGNLTVQGTTYLGNANGDETHINDILRVGATDSGDSHFYFGEGALAGSDYGSHWHWDSGYTFTWNTRNAGTDTSLFDYVTNDTSYINWRRSFHMQNKAINYAGQLHFNGGTRFVSSTANYLIFKTDSTTAGGIQVQDGNASLKGYTGYYDSSGFGLLNSTGNWGIRLNPGNVGTELYYAGSLRLDTRSGGIGVQGNVYTDTNFGYGLVGNYSATRYQGVFAMGDSYKLSADGTTTGTLYGIAWTHTNVGGQSKSGLGHQMLIMENGTTTTAIGKGIWTDGLITSIGYGTSSNWNTAYGWGNHASAGYLTSYTDTNTTYTAGTGLTLTGTVFSNAAPNVVQTTVSGNAGSATVLQTARTVNGVSFNGSANISVGSIYDSNYRRVGMPGGAEYVTQASTVTGAIAIEIPFFSGMYKFDVEVYEYTTDESFTVKVGGHNSGGTWYNEFAQIIGSTNKDRNFNVRFGKTAGGKAIVYIGELGSTWSYPQVFVTNFVNGFSGYSAGYTTGWVISFVTSAFEGITRTRSSLQVGRFLDGNLILHAGNIGSQSVSYATTAGSLTSMNISQFTNNSGYLTSYTDTNTTYTAGSGITLTGTSFSLTTAITNNNQLTNGAGYTTSTGTTTGSGTSNYISKWSGSTSQANSIIYDDGTNVGIGTASPTFKLDVLGTARVNTTSTTLIKINSTGSGTVGRSLIQIIRNDGIEKGWDFGTNVFKDNSDNFTFREVGGTGDGLTRIIIKKTSGNVGIGTTSPSTPLHVNGIITATGGDSTNWNTAYGWGNHASAGYQLASTAITTSNIGSQSVSNATTAGGLVVGTGVNNGVNQIVRTNSSGYLDAGWINTISGTASGTVSRIYCSQDAYIRYLTPANFISNLGLISTGNIGSQSVSSATTAGSAGTTAAFDDGTLTIGGGGFLTWDVGPTRNMAFFHNGSTGAMDYRTELKFRNQDGIEYIRLFDNDYWTGKMTLNIDAYNTNNGLGTTGGSASFVVDADSNAAAIRHSGIIQAVSDRREKHQILPITNAVEKVKGIVGSTYYRTNNEERFAGVIAQDVLEVLPEAVWGSEETRYSVDYNALIALLVQSTKEQQETIDALTERIQILENK